MIRVHDRGWCRPWPRPHTDQPPPNRRKPKMTTYEDYNQLNFSRRDNGVLLITLDRPEKYNAADERMHTELARVWKDVSADPDTRVAVITGAGKAFSAGGDLGMVERMAGNYEHVSHMLNEMSDLVYNIINCEKPSVSAINGVAVGAGTVAALLAEAPRVADSLATGAQHAIRLTKRTLNNWLRSAGPTFDQSAASEMLTFLGPDVVEGYTALREKRPPRFPSTQPTSGQS